MRLIILLSIASLSALLLWTAAALPRAVPAPATRRRRRPF